MTLQADSSMNLSADLHNRLSFGFINRRRIGRIRDRERVFFFQSGEEDFSEKHAENEIEKERL